MATEANKPKPKGTRPLEAVLWDAADKMRGNLEASEYKHVVLGLVFLKYISDAFEQRHAHLETATADATSDYFVSDPSRRHLVSESRDEYLSDAVFWVPETARWSHLQQRAKLPEIGQLIDTAMDVIEKENPSLRGVLPRTYARTDIRTCAPIGSVSLRWQTVLRLTPPARVVDRRDLERPPARGR